MIDFVHCGNDVDESVGQFGKFEQQAGRVILNFKKTFYMVSSYKVWSPLALPLSGPPGGGLVNCPTR